MSKRTFAEALSMGLSGGAGGAKAGSAFGPEGAAYGGLLGGGLGLLGGYLDAQAYEDSPEYKMNLQEQGLNNQLLSEQLAAARRQNKEGDAQQAGLGIFRKFMGAGLSAGQPTSFGAALKAYPGLGNQIQ